jgi:2-polyprenyl-3-methyl-5-hydroxy-6-metoxy-1,4-benzoquinol methylase
VPERVSAAWQGRENLGSKGWRKKTPMMMQFPEIATMLHGRRGAKSQGPTRQELPSHLRRSGHIHERQAAALGAILERECGAPSAMRILDCACGIGTQTLAWPSLGFRVTACDLSPAPVERTRAEAVRRRLHDQVFVSDILDLTELPGRDFDAVMSKDNALPHLKSDEQCFKGQHRFGEN